MTNCLVSVIVPNYNHEQYLKQRIDSILNQSYKNIEVIILDDCSTDNSKSVIEQYRSHNAVKHIIYNEHNSGTTFKQWDKGIALASGEWVWIAESDDWCEPTLLQTLIDGVEEKTCISYCQSILCYSNGHVWVPIRTHRYQQAYEGNEFVNAHMLFELPVYNASMAIFKKNVYYSIDKYFTTFKFCGDWLFWILAARHGDVTVSGKFLNYFRKHDKDVSGKAYNEGLFYTEYIKLMDYLLDSKIVSTESLKKLMIQKYSKFIDDVQLNSSLVTGLRQMLLVRVGRSIYSRYAYSHLGYRKFFSALVFKLRLLFTK